MSKRARGLDRMALALAAGGVAAWSALAVGAPPVTVTSLLVSGDPIEDVGVVNSSFYNNNQVTPCTGGRGIIKVAVNNDGQWLVQTDSPSINTFQDTALISSLIPPTFLGHSPYLIEGTPGYLSAPTFQAIAAPFGMTANVCSPPNPFWADNAVGAIAVGNSGVNAMMLRYLPSASADPVVDASSGVFHGLTAAVALQGQPVNATGLDPGTVWGPLTSESATMGVNSSNQYLIVGPVVELGVTKRAVVVVNVDPIGTVLGATLVAKEGGPVGGGPSTWTTISAAPYTAAINDSGSVIFSGRTSGGVSGLFLDGIMVAVEGGPTPDPNKTWGSLLGVPVDLNNHGDFVLRALTADGSGIWNELSPDAGEETDGQNGLANLPADSTVGNGALTRIVGSLSSDTDVDMYRIRITDPATFSATTVPDPGSGFAGANFDTVLYLIREPGSGTNAIARSDDVSGSVVQSTLTSQFVPAAGEYYLAITTPKSRPRANLFYFAAQVRLPEPSWTEDPGFIGLGAGRVVWTDPSAGVFRKASATTGALEADGVVGNPQAPSVPAGQSFLTGPMATYNSGGVNKVYWVAAESTGTKIRRSNFDGSVVETVVSNSEAVTTFSMTGLAIDSTSGRMFWSRALHGEVWRTTVAGTNPELMIKIPEEIIGGVVGTFSCKRLAAGAGFVYWTNPVNQSIQRASQTAPAFSGSGAVTTVVTGVNAEQIAVDAAGGKIYWTETAANVIMRANLDGTGVEVFLSTPRPVSIATDGTSVFWSNGDERVIRRSPIASPAETTLVMAGADTGVTMPNSLVQSTAFIDWERVSAGSPGALPYQVRLTGASPRIPDAMIAKNNTVKVVGTYDPVPGRPNSRITVIGSSQDAFKLSDRGDVLWRGTFFEPTIFINAQTSALFLNHETVLVAGEIPPTFADRLVFFYAGPGNIDMSRSGEWAVVSANTQVPPFNFTFQPDRALLLRFDFPPGCLPDFNQDGSLDPDDLGDFINCYFAVPPCDGADFNTDGSVDPDDLGDFINAYFAGC